MFSVRKADQNDCLDIAIIHFTSWKAVYADLLPESYINAENILAAKIRMWKSVLSHPKITVWIAYDSSNNKKGKIVGFIGYFNKANNCEITMLYVLPEYHHLGVGTQLMDAVLEDVSNTTHNFSLSFWILKDNMATITLAREYGFEYSGETNEELYENTKIVDVKMIKVLDEAV